MYWGRPPPPAGAIVVEVESDACGTCEPVAGRKFNASLTKPAFFTKSESDWQSFCTEIDKLVQSYKRDGIGLLLTPVAIIGFLLLHPSFGPIAQAMPDNQLGNAIMVPWMMLSIGLIIGSSMYFRKANMAIDERIVELCRRTSSGSGAKLEYVTMWTGACKPKGARTYRALIIAPGEGAGVPGGVAGSSFSPTLPVVSGIPMVASASTMITMQVTTPPTSKGGDTISIHGPDGTQYQVTVPMGVGPGQAFNTQIPAPAAPMAVAVATPMRTTAM